jgi:hypothetical protein
MAFIVSYPCHLAGIELCTASVDNRVEKRWILRPQPPKQRGITLISRQFCKPSEKHQKALAPVLPSYYH